MEDAEGDVDPYGKPRLKSEGADQLQCIFHEFLAPRRLRPPSRNIFRILHFYKPDFRQAIADSWPNPSMIPSHRADWGWKHQFGLEEMTQDIQEPETTPYSTH